MSVETSTWIVGRALALLACFAVPMAEAARYDVTQLTDEADETPGDGLCRTASGGCSLRAAVQEANRSPGLDEIVLGPGTHLISLDVIDDDTDEATGDLDITEAVFIRGADAATTRIEGEGDSGLLHANDGDLELEGLTLARGQGAVRVGLTALTIRDCAFEDNVASLAWPSGSSCVAASGRTVITGTRFSRNPGSAVLGHQYVYDPDGFADHEFIVRDCLFEDNERDIYLGTWFNAGMFITDSVFRDGGGIRCYQCGFGFELRRCLFERCSIAVDLHESLSAVVSDTHFRGGGDWPGPQAGLALTAFEADYYGPILIERSSFMNIEGTAIRYRDCDFRLENSTFVGNRYVLVRDGRTGSRTPEQDVRIRSCTFAHNDSDGSRGDAVIQFGLERGQVSVQNSLFVHNGNWTHWEGFGTSLGHNLVDANFTDLHATDQYFEERDLLLLAPVVNDVHGVRVPFEASSPILDGGDPAGCLSGVDLALETDQPGTPRHLDGDGDGEARCDVGALEHCGPDLDGDGYGDDCDCPISEPDPLAAVDLRVTRAMPTSDLHVSWTREPGHEGRDYELARKELGSLQADGGAAAPCVAQGLDGSWIEPVVEGESLYYLVRAVGSCAAVSGPWGRDSLGAQRPTCR